NRAFEEDPLTLTLTLNRDDQAGFEAYVLDVYNPNSPRFRRFLSQAEITARFGPSQQTYDAVLAYVMRQGFTIAEGSVNHLTLTVTGTRRQAERAFALHIRNYRTEDRTFYANDSDPALPRVLASRVAAISGLSNLAVVNAPLKSTKPKDVKDHC